MNIGVYEGASAMGSLERWQALISQNISAATVPGFKKSEMSFEGVVMGQMEGTRDNIVMPVDTTKVSFTSGTFAQTQNPTDLAIQGEGFFVIKDNSGNDIYTRDGEFHVNSNRELVNKQGYAVQGVGGGISLSADGGEIAINKQGQIYQGNQLVDRVRVMKFDDNSQLQRVQGGFLPGGAQALSADDAQVAQGFLEGSNVSAIDEMVNLIQVTRAQEANQKVIQAYDTRLDNVIKTFSQ